MCVCVRERKREVGSVSHYQSFLYTAIGAAHLHGMGFYLALNALNFAEADRPFGKLSRQQLAKMFFTLGLQCHFSIPYGSGLPMVR